MSAVKEANQESFTGRNGVVITRRPAHEGSPQFRTYEVYQRERVGESTEKIKPAQLISEDYRHDPYPVVEILRENYPCYRDWLSNSYWITRYNDVTSIFTDDANFETRPNAWYYNLEDYGRNLGNALPVLAAEAQCTDENANAIAEGLAAKLEKNGGGDLATEFAAAFAMQVLGCQLGLNDEQLNTFAPLYWQMHRGVSFDPALQQAGRRAIDDLVHFLDPIVSQRKSSPGDDVISTMLQLELDDGPATTRDVIVSLLEADHETLHGALANLWYLLLTHPAEFEKARSERRLMKLAYLETLRHSTPVVSINRFARHEVERFGRLLPEGARLICSAAAANRDPRIFNDPDSFVVDRRDMCQREPRGQYRADGLATGIAFRLGKPSIHPAVPEDRPRSRYALARDTAVTASQALVEAAPNLQLAKGATPALTALSIGEMHTCWKLPVTT